MAYWHETAERKHGWTFPARQGRVAVVFSGYDVRQAPFQGHFLRWEGEGAVVPTGWKQNPEGWVELWPREPLLASSMDEAKAKFQPLLAGIESSSLDDQFEKKPYQPPMRPQLVKEIEHETHQAKARIVQHQDGLYQVGYLVYAPDGKYFPAVTPSIGVLGWAWGVPHRERNTFADNLPSAEQIAAIELAEIVTADPEIKAQEV